MTKKSAKPALKPLKLTCSSTDCVNNLHYFKRSKETTESDLGECGSCGAKLIDWKRLHRQDLSDADFMFNSLKFEMWRHHYWHKPIDEHAENYARRKGKADLREAVKNRLAKNLPPPNAWDGRQTPLDGNIIFYAQHALAICCRKCLERWHGIQKAVPLSEHQINYLTDLIMMYVDERLPDLSEIGVKIPAIRRKHVE